MRERLRGRDAPKVTPVPAPTIDLAPLAAATAGLTDPVRGGRPGRVRRQRRRHDRPRARAADPDRLEVAALPDADGSGARRRAAGLPPPSARPPGPTDPGFRGVLAYSVAEALWLARHGHPDVVVGYPTVDLDGADRAGAGPRARRAAITVMVDSRAHLGPDRPGRPACTRSGWPSTSTPRSGSARCTSVSGARPSTLRPRPRTWPRQIARRDGVRLVGLMLYDAQIAGLPDASAGRTPGQAGRPRPSSADAGPPCWRPSRAVRGAGVRQRRRDGQPAPDPRATGS